MVDLNDFGQPVGAVVEPTWTARPHPAPIPLTGTYVRLEPLSDDHAGDLFPALCGSHDGDLWTYRPLGPPGSLAELAELNGAPIAANNTVTWAVLPTTTGHATLADHAAGMVSLVAIDTMHGRAEIAAVIYARALQRTPATTEVSTLLIRYLIEDLGYRRVEWKCDRLNEPSRQAALRLGFRFEGTFGRHMVVRGRSRDTDYFALTDREWAGVGPAHAAWLDPSNFDPQGQQRTSLRALTSA